MQQRQEGWITDVRKGWRNRQRVENVKYSGLVEKVVINYNRMA